MARTSTPTKTTEAPKRAPRKAAAVAKEPVKKAVPHKPVLTEDQRLDSLEQRVEVLESERPGRKPMPLLAIRQRGVCAVEPDSDSSVCPFASIYRYQSGCHGNLCRQKQHEAYERRKGNNRGTTVTIKQAAKKTSAKKPAAAPTKQPSKRPAKVVSKRVAKKTAA